MSEAALARSGEPSAERASRRGRGGPEPEGRLSDVHIGVIDGAIDSARLARFRTRVAEILRATSVFRADEVEVAIELYDEATGSGGGSREAGVGPRGAVPTPDSTRPTLESYVVLGAFDRDEQLLGYACYGATVGADRVFDLYWIAVDPGRHGAGIGTLLLDEVERRLTGLHARLLVVETSSRSDYAATRGFYARRGYAESARVREFYAPGDDRIILTKRFHSPDGRERCRDE